MRLEGRTVTLAPLLSVVLAFGFLPASPAQAPATPDSSPAAVSQAADPSAATPTAAQAATVATPQKTYTVPSGTKILLQLRSSLNTKSAKPGDGVYLTSAFPVVVGNRVMIPAGVFVQGMVDRVVRAGHLKGKAQLDMHFTSIIFPNGTVVEIPGVVSGMPGASKQKVKGEEGTIEEDSDKTRNAGKTAEIALPTGATVGSIAGLGAGHPLAGSFGGLGAGLAAVGLVSLFTRGADVNIEAGTQVEMVLQRPLILEQENLAEGTAPGAAPAMVPSANQPKPLQKPKLLCPPGSLGCQ